MFGTCYPAVLGNNKLIQKYNCVKKSQAYKLHWTDY